MVYIDYEYIKGLISSYSQKGYKNYLIYYSDSSDDFGNKIMCYFAKSPILQNNDFTFVVTDAKFVKINFTEFITPSMYRQETTEILEEEETIVLESNYYIYTNAKKVESLLSLAVYPSFNVENTNVINNLNFINFILVLYFVTFFVVLIFRKFIFGG